MEESLPADRRRHRLTVAVEELYDCFASYPLNRGMRHCPCCLSDEEAALLLRTPLRRLTASQLEKPARELSRTYGSVEDLKHFLPRVLELTVSREGVDLWIPEMILGTLEGAGFRAWPHREQDCIREYFHGVWDCVLWGDLGNHPHNVDSWLCALSHAEGDLSDYLLHWQNQQGPQPVVSLASVVAGSGRSLLKQRRLENPFWGDSSPGMRQVVNWLAQATTAEYLEHGLTSFAEAFTEEEYLLVSVALGTLDELGAEDRPEPAPGQ